MKGQSMSVKGFKEGEKDGVTEFITYTTANLEVEDSELSIQEVHDCFKGPVKRGSLRA